MHWLFFYLRYFFFQVRKKFFRKIQFKLCCLAGSWSFWKLCFKLNFKIFNFTISAVLIKGQRCPVVFEFFWGRYLGLWANIGGLVFLCFTFIVFSWSKFFKSFWDGASYPLCGGTIVCHRLHLSLPQDCKIMSELQWVFAHIWPIQYSVGVPQKLFWELKCAAKKNWG